MVEKIDAIIEKSTPTLRQLYYTNEALRGAIEFGSTYLIMDNIKKALEEKNDSLLQASKKQLEMPTMASTIKTTTTKWTAP